MKYFTLVLILLVLCSTATFAQMCQFSWDSGSFFNSTYNYAICDDIHGCYAFFTDQYSLIDLTFFWRTIGLGLTVSCCSFYTDVTYINNGFNFTSYSLLPAKVFYGFKTLMGFIGIYFYGSIWFNKLFNYDHKEASIGIEYSIIFNPGILRYLSINSIMFGYDLIRSEYYIGVILDLPILLILSILTIH